VVSGGNFPKTSASASPLLKGNRQPIDRSRGKVGKTGESKDNDGIYRFWQAVLFF
jgi:hypothetical protein